MTYISNVSITKIGSCKKLSITFNNLRTDSSFVNAIRRILIGELKTYSLSGDIDIKTNTTKGLFKNNQIIINTISQIPIFINNVTDKLLNKDPRFIISDINDPHKPFINNNNEDITLYAHNFIIYDNNDHIIDFPIKDIILHNTSFIKLRKGEQIHIEVRPKDGIGRNNYAKWKGARVNYRFESYTSLGLIKPTNIGNSPITNLPFETNDEKQNYPINIYNEPTHITLQISSIDHHTEIDSFILALDTLHNKLLTIINMIDDPNSNNISKIKIKYDDNIDNKLTVIITDLIDQLDGIEHNNPLATDTLANIISSHILYNILDHIGTNDTNNQLKNIFATYKQPHPEDPVIEIYTKIPNDLLPPNINKSITGNHTPSYKIFIYTINQIALMITDIKTEFINIIKSL